MEGGASRVEDVSVKAANPENTTMKNRIDDGLELLLADYQVLYHQLRDYHWLSL